MKTKFVLHPDGHCWSKTLRGVFRESLSCSSHHAASYCNRCNREDIVFLYCFFTFLMSKRQMWRAQSQFTRGNVHYAQKTKENSWQTWGRTHGSWWLFLLILNMFLPWCGSEGRLFRTILHLQHVLREMVYIKAMLQSPGVCTCEAFDAGHSEWWYS